jgi:hypothetical protein
MSRYTLKTFCNDKVLEVFEHRSSSKLRGILSHERFHHADKTGPFGEPSVHPDKFIIVDSQRYRLFEGNIADAIAFLKKL